MNEISMTTNLWTRIINHYYDTGIQDDRDISIYEWLQQDYGAEPRPFRPGSYTKFQFESDEDYVLFLLRWS